MAYFELPEPSGERWLDYFRTKKVAIDTLRRNAHEIVYWDKLLEEGLDCGTLLDCDPRSVVAWVRRSTGESITIRDMMHIDTTKVLTHEALLRKWGDRLNPVVARALEIDPLALERLGLTEHAVAKVGWTSERWLSALGVAPVVGSDNSNSWAEYFAGRKPPTDRREERWVDDPNSRKTRALGVRVLKL